MSRFQHEERVSSVMIAPAVKFDAMYFDIVRDRRSGDAPGVVLHERVRVDPPLRAMRIDT